MCSTDLDTDKCVDKKFVGKEEQPEKDALAFDILLLAHEGVV